jgi:hypothetical protein
MSALRKRAKLSKLSRELVQHVKDCANLIAPFEEEKRHARITA